MTELGKLLLVVGATVFLAGALFMFAGRLHLGHLPGDIVIRGKHTALYFPLGTCIVLSVALSAVIWLFSRLGR
ncbi:MAG TPA: DUF2905 domain-containing protein [Candidatus Angelobacter sp.]|nr:DUF2905 domain-containing protein [Candidatus Angelobacter sp.]